MDAWVAELMPDPNKIKPGLWRAMNDIEDGRGFTCGNFDLKGSLYVVLRGQIDDQGRKWLIMMAGYKRGTLPPIVPTWDEVRRLKTMFFGDADVECIIPVLPRNTQLSYAPAVVNVWRCLDGTILPSWPDQYISPPGWTKEQAEALRIQSMEERAAEAKK